MLTPDWIVALTTVGSMALAGVLWLARLESKVRVNATDLRKVETTHISTFHELNTAFIATEDRTAKSIDKMEEKTDLIFNQIFEKLSSIEKSIARIEGKLFD